MSGFLGRSQHVPSIFYFCCLDRSAKITRRFSLCVSFLCGGTYCEDDYVPWPLEQETVATLVLRCCPGTVHSNLFIDPISVAVLLN